MLALPGTSPADPARGAYKLSQNLLPRDGRRRQPAFDQFRDILRKISIGLAMSIPDHVAYGLFRKTFRGAVRLAPDFVIINSLSSGCLCSVLSRSGACLSVLALVNTTKAFPCQGTDIKLSL